MAAVLTDGDRYFFGLNSRETHPLQQEFGHHEQSICLHAEVAAIVKATRAGLRDLSSFHLYVARVYADGTTGLAKPCPGCERAIVAFKIKEVQWTTSSK